MAKVILSRKGFDSSYGGASSPIMPNGDLLSMPIPANAKERGIPYSDIRYGERSYLDLMEELGIPIPENQACHFDPDLIKDACQRKPGWKGIFGQQGAACTHLENQGVEEGDIFLFFGSFKRTHQGENLRFERDHERHIIFAYLIVEEVLRIGTESHSIYEDHPHFRNKELYHPRNVAYLAQKDGFGSFKYRDELVLTKQGFPKSIWQLPMIFHPSQGTEISRHSERDIELRGDHIQFRSRGIGQDFVVAGNPGVEAWALDLISGSEEF